jgi:hypothetical protein
MAETEIVGPFKDYRLVINGWSVPLIDARELDGGQMYLTLDKRIALQLPADQFDQVARFIADVIGACWGYGAHPSSDEFYESADLPNRFDDPAAAFRNVPHPSLAPRRMTEIAAAQVEDGDEPDA